MTRLRVLTGSVLVESVDCDCHRQTAMRVLWRAWRMCVDQCLLSDEDTDLEMERLHARNAKAKPKFGQGPRW